MKNLLLAIAMIITLPAMAQREEAYQDGEHLKFRVHYGLVTAGYATLDVVETTLQGRDVHHIKGYGVTTGMTKFFFKVEDIYQSYVDMDDDKPHRFIRKIDEGGHTKDFVIDFDHNSKKANVLNKETNKLDVINMPREAQDMVSSFYYLRNNLNTDDIKEGYEVEMDMFMDKEIFKFKMKFLGRETLKTTFGKVPCLMFRPYVEAGRVFKEKESLTIWVSDDENKIPMLIKAELAVGSLKASLNEYSGLKHEMNIIDD